MKSIHDAVDHKLYSEEDIAEMTKRLGQQLTKDYSERNWRLILTNVTKEELNECRERYIAR